MGSGCEARRFFQKQGFGIIEAPICEYSATLANLDGVDFFQTPIDIRGLCYLNDVNPKLFRAFEEYVRANGNLVGLPLQLLETRDYNDRLSLAYVEKNEILGVVLCNEEQGEISLSSIFVKRNSNCGKKLIFAAAKNASRHYKPDTKFKLLATNDAMDKLAKALLPNAQKSYAINLVKFQ